MDPVVGNRPRILLHELDVIDGRRLRESRPRVDQESLVVLLIIIILYIIYIIMVQKRRAMSGVPSSSRNFGLGFFFSTFCSGFSSATSFAASFSFSSSMSSSPMAFFFLRARGDEVKVLARVKGESCERYSDRHAADGQALADGRGG